jgi:hypothetical protein
VVVNSPVNNTEVGSRFSLSATAVSCASENVSSMGYSFDSSADTIVINGPSIETLIESSPGTHTLHVKALGDGGTECVSDVTITVKPDSSMGVPSGATSASNIQAMSHWEEAHDTAGKGHSSGSTKIVSSPSIHGSTREFETQFSGGGDERFSIRYADDTQSHNFFYDGWVYFPDSADKIANLELDTNQAIGDGKVVIFGVQCDGYAGKWDFTENVGSVKHGRPHWKPVSGTSCNPRDWSKNTWHHVQASYSREDSGKITYHSVWLDGKENKMDATVNGLFDLGWSPQINTQFQVDGLGSSGSTKAYLDSLTISRW